jgi:hypothetical protein
MSRRQTRNESGGVFEYQVTYPFFIIGGTTKRVRYKIPTMHLRWCLIGAGGHGAARMEDREADQETVPSGHNRDCIVPL